MLEEFVQLIPDRAFVRFEQEPVQFVTRDDAVLVCVECLKAVDEREERGHRLKLVNAERIGVVLIKLA